MNINELINMYMYMSVSICVYNCTLTIHDNKTGDVRPMNSPMKSDIIDH